MTSFEFESNKAPNREELLRMAINTAKQGNRGPARVMFTQILSEDKQNERAMLWMAKLADTKAERQQWLNRVLAVNPNNESARVALQRMNYKSSARENQTLILFGAIVIVLIVLGIVLLVLLQVFGGR
jgi:thioredoxin-like negative regulator of GroEL